MITLYYKLRKPITDIKLDEFSDSTIVNIWVNKAYSGSLQVNNNDLVNTLRLYFNTDQDDLNCAAQVKYSGKDIGCIVRMNDIDLPDDTKLLSECGELVTVKDIWLLSGKKGSFLFKELIP